MSDKVVYTDSSREEKKKGGRNVFLVIALILCLAVFLFSGYHIVKEQIENASTDKTVGDLQDVKLEYEENLKNDTPSDGDPARDPASDTDTPIEGEDAGAEEDPRSYRIVLDLLGEDAPSFLRAPLDSAKDLNEDSFGWFCLSDSTGKVSGLPIDLPLVYSGDNEYYLTHNFNKEANVNGWVFADYRNNVERISENYNTILYGHARSDNMFGGLKYLNSKPSWFGERGNHYIYIQTPNEDTVWQIFAWYETSVEEEESSPYNYIRTAFSNPETFVRFCDVLQGKNEISSFEEFEFTADDRILTLSTCKSYDKDVRVVVHAKLVKLGIWE